MLKKYVSKDKYKQSIYHWNRYILQYLNITLNIHCYQTSCGKPNFSVSKSTYLE